MASGGNAGNGLTQYQEEGGEVPEIFWLEYFIGFFGLWTKVTPKELILSCHFLKPFVSENN